MGPKKGGKKKTKAELDAEKLIRDEEERKARELEAKRAAEDAEKRRQEEIRRQIQRNQYRDAELERLRAEFDVYSIQAQATLAQMSIEEEQEQEAISWTRYKDPTNDPNAESERDINTFQSLCYEEEVADLPAALRLVSRVESVAKSVEVVLGEAVVKQNSYRVSKCREYMMAFHDLMMSKIDKSTNDMLRFVDKHLNEHTELQIQELGSQVGVGMWASLMDKDQRPPRKAVIFDKIGIQLDMIKQVLQHEQKFVYRVIRLTIDRFSNVVHDPAHAAAYADLVRSNKYVIGDLYAIDFLYTPHFPVEVRQKEKRWLVRDCSGHAMKLRRALYPSSVPTKVIIKVPDTIIMSEDVRVAVWNEEKRVWTEEGTSLFEFQEAERKAIFYTVELGTFALLRDRNSDFPLRRWTLAPFRDPSSSLHEKTARMTIQTMKHELVVEILGAKCRLLRINTKAFDDLIGVEMSVGLLLQTLQRRGLNLMYNNGAVEGLVTKTSTLEWDTLQQIGRCASACEFTSSGWNQQVSANEVGILVKESTVYTGSVESFDYECVLAENDATSESCLNATVTGAVPGAGVKYTLVMGNEYGTKRDFSRDPRPDEVTHLTLAGALASRLTPEARERIDRVNGRFADTVFLLLRTMNVYSLS